MRYEIFKRETLLLEVRPEKGLNQSETAGITKSYISKIENNINEVRISALQKLLTRLRRSTGIIH
jgi:transcriptional regulator with XRE-family HTH domain